MSSDSNRMEQDCEVLIDEGLHMRPAMQFVECANRYQSEVYIEAKGNKVNGKSIMQLTMLAASKGTRIKVIAEGADACNAVPELVSIIEGRTPNEFIK